MADLKNICILGSTGSIGRNALEVIANFPDRFRVTGLSARRNVDLLLQQIKRFQPEAVAVQDEASASQLKHLFNGSLKVLKGETGFEELAALNGADIVVSSLVGFAGLRPTIEAIKQGKTVALANKETLVVAGEIITGLVRRHGATLLPIDSEHSAILQCLSGENRRSIARLILTASGGPFLNVPREDFGRITVEDALNHPNWKMGKKITIDSATLMNKGLEVIEAHWLFGLPQEKIDVLIHPQSIIHSMVEFVDGSVKAQMGLPDMKIPIQYALTYPERASSAFDRVNFAALRQMTFFEPDRRKFECLDLAYRALRCGGTAPAILNAANEVAVDAFLRKQIRFNHIPEIIGGTLEGVPSGPCAGLDDVVNADLAARRFAVDIAGRLA